MKGRGGVLGVLRRTVYRLEDVMMKASGIVIFLLAVISSASVVGRYFFDLPVPDMPTLGEQLMVFIIFFALARTQRSKAHVRVDALVDRLPAGFRKTLNVAALILAVIVFSVLAWQSWRMAVQSWAVRDSASVFPYYPVWPARFLVPIGSFLMVCQLIIDIFAVEDSAGSDA